MIMIFLKGIFGNISKCIALLDKYSRQTMMNIYEGPGFNQDWRVYKYGA